MVKHKHRSLLGLKYVIITVLVFLAAANILQFQKINRLNIQLGEMPDPLPSQMALGMVATVVDWRNPKKPMQSLPAKEDEVPKEAVRVGVENSGFKPAVLKVMAGKPLVLAVTALGDGVHVFKFREPALKGVEVGVANRETRLISFYAPAAKGDYNYYSDVPGQDITGVMRVE